MTKTQTALLFLGVALMSWGGAGVSTRLGLTGWHASDVALFAVGIILLARVPYYSLAARIRQLETEQNRAR